MADYLPPEMPRRISILPSATQRAQISEVIWRQLASLNLTPPPARTPYELEPGDPQSITAWDVPYNIFLEWVQSIGAADTADIEICYTILSTTGYVAPPVTVTDYVTSDELDERLVYETYDKFLGNVDPGVALVFPAAEKNHWIQISVSGTLSGVAVTTGEKWYCTTNGTAANTPGNWQKMIGSASSFAMTVVNAVPGNGTGADGDIAQIAAGQVLEGMLFRKVSGTWTYQSQSFTPQRSTVISAVDRASIANALLGGRSYWYYLNANDGVNTLGWYRITSDGIQLGPYV